MSFSRRFFPIWAALVLGLCGIIPARAQVLIWSIGDSPSGTQQVADYLMATNLFPSVAIYTDPGLVLNDLLAYQQVLFFTNGAIGADMVATGDVLADYSDTGRRLVLATFSWANQGSNTLSGRIITEGISPFIATGSSAYSTVNMLSNDGGDFFAGVNVLNGYYHDTVGLNPGALLYGTWSDGLPLLAQRNNVIAVNLYPVPSNLSGDYAQLFANALFAIPEPSTVGLFGLGILVVGYRMFRGGRRQGVSSD